MKKSLFLLPLLAFALTGCGNSSCNHVDANPKDHKCDNCGTVMSSHSDANGDHLCDTCAQKISDHTYSPIEGKKHQCTCGDIESCADANKDGFCDVCGQKVATKPEVFAGLTISGNDMYDASASGSGYAYYSGDHDVDGYNVNFNGSVMINADPGNSLTQDEEPENEYKVIQFRKQSGGAGVMTVEDVKPSKAIIKVLLNDHYSWANNQIGALTFNSSKLTVPSTSSKEACDYVWMYNETEETTSIHTVEVAINATEDGDFVITNSGSFAFYILSIELVA